MQHEMADSLLLNTENGKDISDIFYKNCHK